MTIKRTYSYFVASTPEAVTQHANDYATVGYRLVSVVHTGSEYVGIFERAEDDEIKK
jgi:hypothetical protein